MAASPVTKAQRTEPHIRLHYFNGRGLGELPRLCLSFAGLEFEDVRFEDAPAELRATGKLTFGQGPLLEVGDFTLVQSHAIARYLARKYDFYGSTPEHQAQVDAVLDGFADLRSKYISQVDNVKGEAQEAAKAEFIAKTLPHWYGLFSGILQRNGTGFFVGSQISLADIQAFNLFWSWENRPSMFPGAIAAFPLLQALVARVGAEPRIAAWVARRPASEW